MLPSYRGYNGTSLPVGQFASYRSVLNHGKVTIPTVSSKNMIKCKSSKPIRKFSGYLLVTLLLAGGVHLNPGPCADEVGPESRAMHLNTGPCADEVGPDQHHLTAFAGSVCQRLSSEDTALGCGHSIDGDSLTVDAGQLGESFVDSTPVTTFQTDDVPSATSNHVQRATLTSLNKSTHKINPAIVKHRCFKLFRTVNHACILWDHLSKPSGILGGHLNIRSLIPKNDQIHHLLYESNLDFLCLSETWLYENSPVDMLNVCGYKMYRRDRIDGRGGGVLFYVKDSIRCDQIQWSSINEVECICQTNIV